MAHASQTCLIQWVLWSDLGRNWIHSLLKHIQHKCWFVCIIMCQGHSSTPRRKTFMCSCILKYLIYHIFTLTSVLIADLRCITQPSYPSVCLSSDPWEVGTRPNSHGATQLCTHTRLGLSWYHTQAKKTPHCTPLIKCKNIFFTSLFLYSPFFFSISPFPSLSLFISPLSFSFFQAISFSISLPSSPSLPLFLYLSCSLFPCMHQSLPLSPTMTYLPPLHFFWGDLFLGVRQQWSFRTFCPAVIQTFLQILYEETLVLQKPTIWIWKPPKNEKRGRQL